MKVAVVDPLPTVTPGGTETLGAPLVSTTTSPPAGAAEFSETVQETVPEPVMLLGVHDRPVTCWGSAWAFSVIDTVRWMLLADAVITAVTPVETALA